MRFVATRNGMLHPQFIPTFLRLREVVVGHRQVVLMGDGRRVPQPRADDVGRETLFEFRLPASSAVLERLRPLFDPSAADDLAERPAT